VVGSECYVLIPETKKKSLANTLRKRFARGKDGPRAQSVERLPAPYDSNLLRPPDSLEASRVSGNLDLFSGNAQDPLDTFPVASL